MQVSNHISHTLRRAKGSAGDPLLLLSEEIRRYFNDLISSVDKVESGVKSIKINLNEVNIINWLDCQTNSQKIYWQSRSKESEIAGIGSCYLMRGENQEELEEHFLQFHEFIDDEELFCFGGLRFDEQSYQDRIWNDFPAYLFRIPEFEIRKINAAYFFHCNFLLRDNMDIEAQRDGLLKRLSEIDFNLPDPQRDEISCSSRIDNPDYSGWDQNIQSSLNVIANGEMEKVVMARRTTFIVDKDIDPFAVLRHLKASNPNSFLFLFQNKSESTFLGSTPEQLYTRDGLLVETEAVAGTRLRGENAKEDQRFKQELLNSVKDRREHQYVVRSIETELENLCSLVEKDKEVGILENARVQHLLLRFRAKLHEGVTDAQLLAALHPTPAVGGYPTKTALRKIRQLEKFDRGWYAGPVGWLNKDEAEFAVGIRSVLIKKNKLHLFAGAGIVNGSESQEEWRELENKISGYKKFFKCSKDQNQ